MLPFPHFTEESEVSGGKMIIQRFTDFLLPTIRIVASSSHLLGEEAMLGRPCIHSTSIWGHLGLALLWELWVHV